MAKTDFKLTYECAEQLHAWIHSNCPCVLDNQEFLPGVYAIVEMEIETALERQRSNQFRQLQTPSLQ